MSPRNDWVGRIPARRRVVADPHLIPTGQYRPMDLADPFLLENRTLDDGFTDLDRDPDGRARFYIASSGKTVEVLFGPKWQAAVVWEPNDAKGQPQQFICFEPMAGITNAINLNHEGKYPELQMRARRRQMEREFLGAHQRVVTPSVSFPAPDLL